MSKKPIVEVKNLKISSNNNYLIRDLSFKVMPNEILGIIGESGSGKSLTALSVIDLIKYKGLKQQGEIVFNPNLIETQVIIWANTSSVAHPKFTSLPSANTIISFLFIKYLST